MTPAALRALLKEAQSESSMSLDVEAAQEKLDRALGTLAPHLLDLWEAAEN